MVSPGSNVGFDGFSAFLQEFSSHEVLEGGCSSSENDGGVYAYDFHKGDVDQNVDITRYKYAKPKRV